MSSRTDSDPVLRALRRVNLQGSLFGQTVGLRLGLSESDIEALEVLIDTGASTAGRLAESMGLSTGAVTRMIDRLEQAGYVVRVTDPADRRRVVVELVPERVARVRELLDTVAAAAAAEIGRYSPDQLEAIGDFLGRMAEVTRLERERLREAPAADASAGPGGDHAAPVGALREARLLFRNGASELRLRADAALGELYRARFEGTVPQVRLRDGTVTVQYRRGLFDWRRRSAEIALNTGIDWTIEIRGGASNVDASFDGLRLRALDVSGGAAKLKIRLGEPSAVVPIRFEGGASEIALLRPAGTALQLAVRGGAARLEFDGQRLGAAIDARFESEGASRARDRYMVELIGGAAKLTVRTDDAA